MRFLQLKNQLNGVRFGLTRCCIETKYSIQFPSRFSSAKHRNFSSQVGIKPSSKIPKNGPGLKEFLIAGKNSFVAQASPIVPENTIPYLEDIDYSGHGRKVFFEVYGCQMNVNDTEIVWSILKDSGYEKTESADSADVVLLMTCAIREKAETKV